MHERTAILIAQVLLDGPFSEASVRKRLCKTFQSGHQAVWPRRLFEFAKQTGTGHDEKLISPKLVHALSEAVEIPGIALAKIRRLDEIAKRLHPTKRPVAQMLPLSVCAAKWDVPSITTVGQLADSLSIPQRQLDWFVDLGGREASANTECLWHYRYRWIRKQSGGQRLLETPKAKLKEIQRTILSKIINHIPVHPAAHGFVRKRSSLTAAQLHAGKQVVLRIDLRQFFPSVHVGKVIATFRAAGYPQAIAQCLAGLCTNTTPNCVLRQSEQRPTFRHRFHDPSTRHFLLPHLPQGSPTSPALANLAASKLDARLVGLAYAFDATYTRYADDLVFSGNEKFSRGLRNAKVLINAICLNEGFQIQHRKTTIQRQHQQQKVHGIVVNSVPAVSRKQRDELKAILTNCIRRGPSVNNQNGVLDFRAHLQGRIAVVHAACPRHGEKLKTLFQQITWQT